MRRSPLERRLRDELHSLRPPRSAEAERRAWHVVAAAHAECGGRRPRHARRRVAVVLVAAALACALVLTPAGAQVSDWIDDVVSPAPEATRSSLASLPAEGRLLVVSRDGPFIVRDDGARRRLGAYRDATWSPGGLYVAVARGRELTAVEPDDGHVRWTRVAPARVDAPRWSPDGFRIAYESGGDLYVVVGNNVDNWLLDRNVEPVPPAWRPRRPDNQQVLAYARGDRILVARADLPRRVLFRTPPGPRPREIWWSAEGRRLIAVSERSVRIHNASGRLLRDVRLPRGLRATGSALSPGGRLAMIAAAPGARSSELLLLGINRAGPPRRRLGGFGPLEGLTWSIDGKVLVAGLPQADQWVFLRMRGRGGFVAVDRISANFGAGPNVSGAFPRPAGWCYAEPDASKAVPCSAGAAP